MSLIYEPKGKAREYSPLALNVYSGGCDHQCRYCYCKNIVRGDWSITPNVRNLEALEGESRKANRQILLSFMGDPYCSAEAEHRQTRKALEVLSKHCCSVAILTKGGGRCLDDLDLFCSWPDKRVKVGATLTFMSEHRSREEEPGAALPQDRLYALKTLRERGVKTWVSIEPVLDPVESLLAIKASLPFVDAYKVGKLNHQQTSTDWKKFCVDAVTMIRSAGRTLYVKDDLRAFVPEGFLTPKECDPETVFLPNRPAERTLL